MCEKCSGTGFVRVGMLTTFEGGDKFTFKRTETIPFDAIPVQKQLMGENQRLHDAVVPCPNCREVRKEK